MNIKKRIPKFISLLLSFTVAFGNVIPAYAMENTNSDSTTVIDGENVRAEERNLEDITVTYKQASSFFVTIPKTIILDGWKQSTYSVKVSGDIDAEQCVYIAPVDGIDETENIDFYMKDQASENAKDDVVANVTHKRFHWNSAEVAEGHKQDDNLVSAPDLTAGAWRGIFQMEIRLETKKEHEHNYVDGKCECDAIDPNHEHNYEDGKCTICGKEVDPYEIAPANAFRDWQYTLDEDDKIIYLRKYNNTSATDVIVYGNYEIDGNVYKTKLADDSSGMFAYKDISTVKFSDEIDTSNVTNMWSMFEHCMKLKSVDLSHFNTQNVTTMKSMFNYCPSLASLDVSNFDTSNVTDMSRMFYYCSGLTDLNVSNFDTSNVTTMESMFYICSRLPQLDLSSFDTSNVTDMSYMFTQCSALPSLDLSSFDTRKATNMGCMFKYDSALETIYVTEGKWSTVQAESSQIWDSSSAKYRNGVYDMFDRCGTSSVTYK